MENSLRRHDISDEAYDTATIIGKAVEAGMKIVMPPKEKSC